MELTHVKASGWRRTLLSGAALGTAAALTLGGLVATPAFAAPGGSSTGTGTNEEGRTATLTVTPAQGLDAENETTLDLTGANYATTNRWGQNFGGAYILFGVINPTNPADPGSWAPSKGGQSGTNYDYAAGAAVYQWMVNYPGNDTEPGAGSMDASGNWSEQLTIPGARFQSQAGNEIDCFVQQCGVITIGAHGQQSAGVEVFTPVTFEDPDAEPEPAVETTTTFTAATPASNAVKNVGVTLKASVAPATAAGTVEFLVGETVVGSAQVVDGAAETVSTEVPGGQQTISARFVPTDEAAFTASTASATRSVRVVDTTRAVADITVGAAAETISDAELVWSVSNIAQTSPNDHRKSVLSGDVTLTDAATEAARDFVFTGGTGSTDAAGNTVIEFTGSIQIATRTNDVHKIVLTDPSLRVNAAGEGYITADFSGSKVGGAYAPVADVTIATLRGVTPSTVEGKTSFTIAPLWDDQTAAGTWNGSYTNTFPNEFVTLLDSAVRTDFYQGGTTALHTSKAPRAIEVEYTSAEVVPVPEPSGVSTGTPYSDTTAHMIVTPGEDLRVAGATQVTVQGVGYDPAKPIYVGLGTMKDFGDPEKWRRSKGGSSGPVGMGDYTYGAPRLVVANGSSDGDVADAEMDANGNWSFTLTIPSAQVPSFFGDTIQCGTLQCGFFSFGAHGVVNSKNEAFTPVYFAGQTPPAPAPAEETTTTVAVQASGAYPTDFAGEDVTVSATVAPAAAAGSVEFFAGADSLGSATVENGAVSVTTDRFTGGAHQVTAVFTPADSALFEASTSAVRTYRIVDLTPAVSGIETGAAVKEIAGAQLNWSIANYVSFGSGPGKAVLDGNVVLSALPESPTAADRANQEFIFSGGTGVEDASGNRVVSFDGEVRLTSGSMPTWNFRQPTVHVNAAGDGYITAVIDGEYKGSLIGGEDSTYGPERVIVSTFRGGLTTTQDDESTFAVTPIFEGQVAAGTWAGAYTGATLTNAFLQHVNGGVRSFFLQSGSSADSTKAANPIALHYTAEEIPAPTYAVDPTELSAVDGGSVRVTGTNIDASALKPWGAPSPAGIYVSLGWISNAGWKPSEGNAGATRVAVATKWVQETEPTDDGQYVRWTRNANGTANFEFAFDGVTLDAVNEKKPASGDYRLAVYAIGAGGVQQPVNEFAQDVTFVAEETVTAVASQATGSYPTDFAGEDVTVSATVAPAAAAGTVTFFAGATELGTADVVNGAASVTTDGFAGGAHQVTAVFTPDDAVLYEPSASAAKTFRIVDLTPAVSGIEAGAAVKEITDATLNWSIANFFIFNAGPAKTVLDGNVVLAEAPEGATAQDLVNRDFIFSGGTGVEDAAGNRVVSFDGEVQLTSGSIPTWNFRQPTVHVNAAGDGYITAIVDGSHVGSSKPTYGPERMIVTTFTGAATVTDDGVSSFTVAPMFEGQVDAGTWAGEFTAATFTNEFLQHVDGGVRSFFYQSSTSASQATKAGLPIDFSYTAGNAPAFGAQPANANATAGESASFSVQVSGTPAPALQWQSRANASEAWVDVPGATGATLTLSDLEVSQNGSQYRAVATNAFGTLESAAATLAVAPVKPGAEPEAPTLTPENEVNEAGFTVVSVDGRVVTVNVGAQHANEWIGVFLHSDPQFLGWFLADALGNVTVTVPASVTGAHRLSFVNAAGALLGWVPVSYQSAGGTGGVPGATGAAGGLSTTGGQDLFAVGGVALLMLVSGGVLLAARRRRTAAE